MHIGFSCLNFLSMFMLFFAYGKIYRFIGRHNNAVHPSLQASRNSQRTLGIHEMKASRVLFATVFSFCVSWIPAGVLIILEYGFAVSIPSTARSIPFLFASTSAWINPVIYGVMNRAMHREYGNIIFCRKENWLFKLGWVSALTISFFSVSFPFSRKKIADCKGEGHAFCRFSICCYLFFVCLLVCLSLLWHKRSG